MSTPKAIRLCPPQSCTLGLGAAWVELVAAPDVILFMRVPSNPSDIESRPRDYSIILGEAERLALATALLAGIDPTRRLREVLYPIVTIGLEAEAAEDFPEYVNGEMYNAMSALPECSACQGKGSTDGKEYVDEPIPDAVRCTYCRGWGFLKHPGESEGA